MFFQSSVFLLCLAIGPAFTVSCYGRTATAADLPNPADDDRPPGSPPELPRVAVELPEGPSGPVTRIVTQSADLQRAIDEANPGDVIALQAGVVFKGALTLPAKAKDGWITIRTSVPDGVFPGAGTRVSPSDARLMPVIESDDECAIQTVGAAHHYRFIGVEIRPAAGLFVLNVVLLGADAKSVDALPHHIVFERCYIHGDPKVGSRRGVALNARHAAVLDSYISDFKDEGEDTQAVAVWNGAGPFAIINNYLEGAGENVLFGGADPAILNLVPSDIVIRGNVMSKPLAWRNSQWQVKNLFELKNARRVLVEQNFLEYNWLAAQNGYAILFTPRNQNGDSPWSMVRDVTFRNNVIRHVASGVNILGSDDIQSSQQTKRIVIRDNLFDDIDETRWGGSGVFVQVTHGALDVTVDHNTSLQSGSVLIATGEPNLRFTFTNNLAPHNRYGVGGDSYFGNPTKALNVYFPGVTFVGNVLQGGDPTDYPPGNFFPATMTDIGFMNYADGDYRLQMSSAYKNAGTDGKDVGADIAALPPAYSRHRAVTPGHH